MKIENPGIVVISEDGMTFVDFVFSLTPDDNNLSEDERQSLGTLLALQWAGKYLIAELDRRTDEAAACHIPPKELH